MAMTMMTMATKGTIMVTRTVPAVITTISRRLGSMRPCAGSRAEWAQLLRKLGGR